ncbi:MAG: hypothetical protein VB835_15995 [Pirellulales bacterium]
MSQKRHSVDQIIAKLRRADVLLGKDTKVPEICKQLKIAEQTYYRWPACSPKVNLGRSAARTSSMDSPQALPYSNRL